MTVPIFRVGAPFRTSFAFVMGMNAILSTLSLLTCLSFATSQTASWMSGKWGVGLRTPAGGIAPPVIDNLYVPNFNVTALVQQVKDMGASWLIINLSSGASGDIYISYHPLLYQINPGSTPANVTSGGRDLFGEIALALQNANIACIAYVASEGPAMTKSGANKAYDATIGSPSVTNWLNWVQAKYGRSDNATLHIAFAKEIVSYYANRYGDLVSGWWFDQSRFANIALLQSVIKNANPNTVAMFNDGEHVPLFNSQPGLEDATAGPPLPITKTAPNDFLNYPIITSIENSTGWLKGPNGELALGHIFMPFGDSWNAIGTQNVWNQSQAADWMGRVLRAGGAWTWNLPRHANGATIQPDSSLMSYQIVTFVQKVVASFPKRVTQLPTPDPTLRPPIASPTSKPSTKPTNSSTEPNSSPNSQASNRPTSMIPPSLKPITPNFVPNDKYSNRPILAPSTHATPTLSQPIKRPRSPRLNRSLVPTKRIRPRARSSHPRRVSSSNQIMNMGYNDTTSAFQLLTPTHIRQT